VFENITS